MQGTWVQSLVQEDPTWHRATKPVRHNYWAHMPQVLKPACSRACAPQQEKLLQWEAHALQLDNSPYLPQLQKACVQQQRPSAANK